jgi:hypothetical protein
LAAKALLDESAASGGSPISENRTELTLHEVCYSAAFGGKADMKLMWSDDRWVLGLTSEEPGNGVVKRA